jgi:RimJ/RimL family protein N-acetyltransferase
MDILDIPTLETKRLRLRAFRKSDLDDYAALNADREAMRFIGDGEPWDRGRARRHLAFQMGLWLLGDVGMWVLEHKETGAFVGVGGFHGPEGWPGFELAGSLARRFWGQGYALEAAREALAYAFKVLHKERVISLVHPDNHASIRVVERLGETLEGRIQHFGREKLVYGIDRESYLTRAARDSMRQLHDLRSGEH